MTIFATAGAELYIGSTSGTFASQAWVQIKHVEGLGTLGDTSSEITFDSIDEIRTTRLKGTRNAGTMEVVCGIDSDDAGQLALIAAEKTPHNYAFRVVLNDAPPGGTPSERRFWAAVGAVTEAYDTANSVVKLNASLWVNSEIDRVAAAE
jgi:hypothetical protein